MLMVMVEMAVDRENGKSCRAASRGVPVAGQGGGPARSSAEAPVMGVERRGRIVAFRKLTNHPWEESDDRDKVLRKVV